MRQCHAPHLTLRHFEACHVCNMLELHTAITGSGAFWRSSNSKYNDSVCCENRDGEMSRSNIANLVLSPIENQGIRCVYISISKLQWSCRCQPSLVQLAYKPLRWFCRSEQRMLSGEARWGCFYLAACRDTYQHAHANLARTRYFLTHSNITSPKQLVVSCYGTAVNHWHGTGLSVPTRDQRTLPLPWNLKQSVPETVSVSNSSKTKRLKTTRCHDLPRVALATQANN